MSIKDLYILLFLLGNDDDDDDGDDNDDDDDDSPSENTQSINKLARSCVRKSAWHSLEPYFSRALMHAARFICAMPNCSYNSYILWRNHWDILLCRKTSNNINKYKSLKAGLECNLGLHLTKNFILRIINFILYHSFTVEPIVNNGFYFWNKCRFIIVRNQANRLENKENVSKR